MPRSSRIAAIFLAGLYVAFWFWWGGSGKPLSPAETQGYLARLTEIGRRSAHSDPKVLAAFRMLASQDDGEEFYMVNLMKYRDKAVYPPGYDYDDDVEAAASRYSRAVLPALLRHGSVPILVARRQGSFLRFDGAEAWDDVGIVRYRSRRDMFEFAIELGAQDQGIHKWASIEKTHVFPTQPIFDLVLVRGALAGLLLAIGVAFHLGMRARAGRPIE